MSNVQSKCIKAEIWETYSEDAAKKAYSKYSFDFTIGGVAYRAWYDPETDTKYFDCGEMAEGLFQLTEEIDRLITESHLKSKVDTVDLHKFVCKHLRAMIKVVREYKLAPALERRHELLKPIDMKSLSLEEKCALEVSKQIDKSHSQRPSISEALEFRGLDDRYLVRGISLLQRYKI
jgi:predicted RNA-binding Zn ribbon-like protein